MPHVGVDRSAAVLEVTDGSVSMGASSEAIDDSRSDIVQDPIESMVPSDASSDASGDMENDFRRRVRPPYLPPTWLAVGRMVELFGLVWRSDLNGSTARILQSHPEYLSVEAADGSELTVRLENVRGEGCPHVHRGEGCPHGPHVQGCSHGPRVQESPLANDMSPRSRSLVEAMRIADEYGLEMQIVEKGGEICSICLEEMQQGDTCAFFKCRHSFHAHCVASWCVRDRTCPNCRQESGLQPG